MLHLRDMFERTQMPNKVRSMWNLMKASYKGLQNCGQGRDFVQEDSNELIKSFLPPGHIPSQEIWTRVCRKAET